MRDHGKIENTLKHKHRGSLNYFILVDIWVFLAKIIAELWGIVQYPLLVALPAFFYFGLLCAWMIAGLGAVLVYSLLWFSPLVAVLIKREENHWKCVNRQ